MAEDRFGSALASLRRPQESRRLLKILVALRKEMEWPKNKANMIRFGQSGCLKQVVACLQRDDKAVDVCLSILGNCCMERTISRSLVQVHNIIPVLCKLLKQNPDSDSINGRVFRIIGNVGQHWDRFSRAIFEQEPDLIKHIIAYLKKSVADESGECSDATVDMGIRAFREILNCETADALVNQHEVLQTVGMVLIKYNAKWQIAKTHENILMNIIRLLHDYSRFKYTKSVLQLRNTGNGDSLTCLGDLTMIAPRKVVRIVMNFITISSLKSDLPIPEICENLQKLIRQQEEADPENPVFKEHLQSLCLLFDHPANRVDDRNNGSIPFLIQTLKNLKTQTAFALECTILIIMTLQKCLYDETLVVLQVRSGVIPAFCEKLEWIVGTSDTLNLQHEIKKKTHPTYSDMTAPAKRRKKNGDHWWLPVLEEDFPFSFIPQTYRCSSPSSSSEMSFSSGRSPPSSPLGAGEGNSDSDNDYSPVCSESEDNDAESEDLKGVLEDDVELVTEEGESSTKSSPKVDENTLSTVKNVLIYEITRVFMWLSKVRPSVPELGCMRVLKLLLKTSKGVAAHSTSENLTLILEILQSQEYLLPLMQTNFIPMVHELTVAPHRGCIICKQHSRMGQLILGRLTILAESGCGKGDIAHQLIRANTEVKRNLVLVLPYIIRNKTILAQFMLNCGGLEVLMKILQEKSDLLHQSIKVLCIMALKNLRIKNPKNSIEETSTETVSRLEDYITPGDCENLVTFKLDDGSSVLADRDFLSEKSEYFNRLLCGQFKESQEKEVTLRKVAGKTLKCLLNLLSHSFSQNSVLNLDLNLPTLLDVILLADKYLLLDLCVRLSESVEKFRMTPETVPQIYEWSVESGTNILRVETIAFVLVTNVVDDERFCMFQRLFDLGLSQQLVEDLRNVLDRFLNACMY